MQRTAEQVGSVYMLEPTHISVVSRVQLSMQTASQHPEVYIGIA